MSVVSHVRQSEAVRWSGLAAVVLMLSAAVFVVPFSGAPTPSNPDWESSTAALLSAGLVGAAAWLVVERYAGGHFIVGGTLAGGATGILAHPLMWLLFALLGSRNPVVGAVDGPLIALLYSPVSLLFVGWITLPLGLLGGLVVAAVRLGVPDLFAR
jgi:hypothetical protein